MSETEKKLTQHNPGNLMPFIIFLQKNNDNKETFRNFATKYSYNNIKSKFHQ